MTIQEGDRMQVGEKWYIAVRTAKRADCQRCALKPIKKKNCMEFCECTDYRFEKLKHFRWEEIKKPIIPKQNVETEERNQNL